MELNPVTWRPAARSVSPPQACPTNICSLKHTGGAPTARTCAGLAARQTLGTARTGLLADASAEHAYSPRGQTVPALRLPQQRLLKRTMSEAERCSGAQRRAVSLSPARRPSRDAARLPALPQASLHAPRCAPSDVIHDAHGSAAVDALALLAARVQHACSIAS